MNKKKLPKLKMFKYFKNLFDIILVGIILIVTSFYLATECTVRIVIENTNDKK